jgi:organic radical activating enzyme
MIQPKFIDDRIFYPVMEHFYTLQGEGRYAGHAAYFIRLSGCDVGCSWCDVKESWEVEEDQYIEISELVDSVKKSGATILVITGGEPAMYNLGPLTDSMEEIDVQINIETSGAYSLSGKLDWVCVSPKRFKFPLEESVKKADELKMIVVNKHDLDWAIELGAKCKKGCVLLLQPEWSRAEKVYPLIIDFIKANPKWKLSLQIHKFLNIP